MDHPSEEILRGFLEDELPKNQALEVDQHLHICGPCQSVVEQITRHEISIAYLEDKQAKHPERNSPDAETEPGKKTDVLDSENAPSDSLDFEFGSNLLAIEEIARGGMGVVYRGYDRVLQREVAIKVGRSLGHAEKSYRFRREARISSQLQHPGIVPVHELGELSDGRPYIAMKLVDGMTLLEMLDEKKPGGKSVLQLLDVFGNICRTMAYAHSNQIIHRDLKPENIMVGAFGQVHIMDWGLAKKIQPVSAKPERMATPTNETEALSSSNGSDQSTGESAIDSTSQANMLTQEGDVFGTPAYMAPEQAQGKLADKRVDVFGLGGILFQILTGKPPFNEPTSTIALARSMQGDLKNAFELLEETDADPELVALVKDCLNADPDQRPVDAAWVLQRFESFSADRVEQLEQAKLQQARSRERLLAQEKRTRQAQWFSAAIFATFLAAGIVGYLYFNERSNRAADQARREREALKQEIDNQNVVRNSLALAQQFKDLAAQGSPEQQSENWLRATAELDKAEPFAIELSDTTLRSEFIDTAEKIRDSADQESLRRKLLEEEARSLAELGQCAIETSYLGEYRKAVEIRLTPRISAAFETIGLIPGKDETAAVQRINQSEFRDDFIYGLLTWRRELRFELNKLSESENSSKYEALKNERQWVIDLIDRIDTDPLRTKLRKLVHIRDEDEYREAFHGILDTQDTTSSLLTFLHVVENYRPIMDGERMFNFFREAHQKYPMEFFTNWYPTSTNLYYKPQLELFYNYTLACYTIQPDNPSVMMNLGNLYMEKGDHERAIGILKKLVEIAPKYPNPYVNLGICYGSLDREEEAMRNFDIAVELGYAPIYANRFRGVYRRKFGDIEGAIEDFEKVANYQQADYYPDLPVVYEQLSQLYEEKEMLAESIKNFKIAVSIVPEYKPHYDRLVELQSEYADALKAENQAEKGIEVLVNGIRFFKEELPNEPKVYRLLAKLGNLYISQNDFASAAEALQEVTKIVPEKGHYREKLSYIYVRAGQPELARSTLRELLKIDKTNTYAYATIANIFLNQNEPNESESVLREAIYDGVNSHTIQLELAKALLAQDDDQKKEEATTILKELERLAPQMREPATILSKIDSEVSADASAGK